MRQAQCNTQGRASESALHVACSALKKHKKKHHATTAAPSDEESEEAEETEVITTPLSLKKKKSVPSEFERIKKKMEKKVGRPLDEDEVEKVKKQFPGILQQIDLKKQFLHPFY